MNRRTQAGTLLVVASALVAFAVTAAPRLAVRVGFGGCFVPEYLAPLRVEIAGVGDSFSGFLLVSQQVGNPWRGEAESRAKIPLHLSKAAAQEYVIPIYDFIGPLRVDLLSDGEEILAERTIELRDDRKEAPFPVVVGTVSPHFDEAFVAVDTGALPVRWAAYEAVSTVWIGSLSDTISEGRWEAIGQWVQAGGSVVLFSGADFYQLDSPSLRELLPFENPSLSDVDGVTALRGELRSGAEVALLRGELPLAVRRRYGAGEVLVCTVRPADLVQDEFSHIAKTVTPAELLSLASDVEVLREVTPLQRPGFPAASLLVLVSLSGFSLIVYCTKRTKHTVVALLALSGVLCVLSGLYINRTKVIYDIYNIKTAIQLQGYFGSQVEYYGLFKASALAERTAVRSSEALIQELPRSLQEHDLTIALDGDGALLTLDRGEWRTLRAFSSSALPVTVSTLHDGKVRVRNGLDGPLKDAVVIAGEEAFQIGDVPVGEGVFTLRSAVPMKDVVSGQEHCTALLRTLCADFFWGEGVWLVGARERQTVQRLESTRTKVRDLLLVAVAGRDRE